MNERQQAHIDYYLERLEYWRGTNLPDHGCLELVRTDARLRHPLLPDEQKLVDEYLAQRVKPAQRSPRPNLSVLPDLPEVS